ncbi:MAG: efflux RND transporter permease subunit [Bacteriovoracaceae bacterium]
MRLFRFFLNQKLFVHYITIVIVILGFMTLNVIQREARPNVNFNRVVISVGYPGAAPSDIEELVIDPIEEKINEVDGIEEYRSVSYSGAGIISIVIDEEHPDLDQVVDDIRRKVAEVNDLPDEVNDPFVSEIKAENIPVLRLALYGDAKPFDLKIEVEKLRDYVKTFDGVQSVSYAGLEDLQLKVLTNPDKLNTYDVTLIEIISRLREWAKQRPGGLLENSTSTHNLTVGKDYNDIDELLNFTVRSNDSGKNVQLKDIAAVDYDTQTTQKRSIFGDKSAVLVTIVKKTNADVVKTVDEVRAGLEDYRKNLKNGLDFKLYTDESKRVRSRLKTVTSNALSGLLLVIIILVLFLDWRSAAVVSLGLPVAVLGGIVMVYLLGNTLNSLVIIGMIIVLGMLVDDAIVVCENIYAYLEEGLSPSEAAIKGVSQISVPVVATVLTTIFAFFPILFMKEIIGQFLRVIPATVIVMLAVSLFEALVILPIHAEEIMRPKLKKKKKIGPFKRIEGVYRKYLEWSLKHRWIVSGILLIFLGISGYQGKQLFQKFRLFPATGLDGLSIRVELKKNSPIEKTSDTLKMLGKELEEISEGTFDSIFSTAGQVLTGGSSGSRQNASHLGSVDIRFTSDPDFIHKEKRIVGQIRKVSKEFAKKYNVKTSITIDRPGPPVGKPIQYEITSRNFDIGKEVVSKIIKEFEKINGVESLETDLDGETIMYRFQIDNARAVSEGVDPVNISRTIFSASTGVITNEILKSNERVEILVGVDSESEMKAKDILNLRIRNKFSQAVPLASFVELVEETSPSSIQRLNGIRTITLFGEVREKEITGKEANAQVRPFIEKLKKEYPTIKISTGGGEKDRMKALKDTMRLYILAIFLIFMVISLSFQSVVYPFLVLLAIPLGLCGVVWSLSLHGQPLSLMGIIGVVGLSGVVVNVSIILLSFIREKIRSGLSKEEAIIQAGLRRLRPIVITTITTLIGLIPTIYGIGGVDTFVQPLALVLGWGLFVATGLSIFALPALVSLVPKLEKMSK